MPVLTPEPVPTSYDAARPEQPQSHTSLTHSEVAALPGTATVTHARTTTAAALHKDDRLPPPLPTTILGKTMVAAVTIDG